MNDNDFYFLTAWLLHLAVGFFLAIFALLTRRVFTLFQMIAVLLLWPLFLLLEGLAALWERVEKL